MKKIAVVTILVVFLTLTGVSQFQVKIPATLLPLDLMKEIVFEASGDAALQTEIFLTGVNRNRPAEEYMDHYFESRIILEKLKEFGIENSAIVEFKDPFGRENVSWDAESAELWQISPEKKKLIDHKEIPASLLSGSVTSDVTAELVYVGSGFRDQDYEGKEIEGKILLVNGSPSIAYRIGVEKYGAAALIGHSSSHPEFDRDQIGWNHLRLLDEFEPKVCAFSVSLRQFQELRDMMEKGQRVVLRAACKTRTVPSRRELVSAVIKGTEYPDEELVFTAHLFEGYAKQGANDNGSGCAAILETARVLKKLVDTGRIPPLKRSVRFLFVPEGSGTSAFIDQFPEVSKRFFANINEDMVGEALEMNNAYFCLKQTPWFIPSYLNDVVAAFIEWVGETNREDIGNMMVRGPVLPIVSPTGTDDPFVYAIDPHFGASDHVSFLDRGNRIPAVMMIAWPDMWYHTNGDLPDKSDPTQLKRVVVISAASAVFLANAGPEEVKKMIIRVSGNAVKRIGGKYTEAQAEVLAAGEKDLHAARKNGCNLLSQATIKEQGALDSISFFIKNEKELKGLLEQKKKDVGAVGTRCRESLENLYSFCCREKEVKEQKLSLSPDEKRLDRLIPVPTEKLAKKFDALEWLKSMQADPSQYMYSLAFHSFNARNYIDGRRSILDICNAVSAEISPVSPLNVEGFMNLMKKLGYIQIREK